MDATVSELRMLLGADRQLITPVFQRPYVWKKDLQWEPLWNDISSLAEDLLAKKPIKPHFLGAIVLEQRAVTVGSLDTRLIIDGQQRLLTVQILLAALRDLSLGNGLDNHAAAIESLMFNKNPLYIRMEQDKFKVWPTNSDQSAYRQVMSQKAASALTRAFSYQLIQGAYQYFFDALSEWTSEQLETRVTALSVIMGEYIKYVVIDIREEDDPQMIFETLNARGTPLTAADLLKNFFFREARNTHDNPDDLYKRYWKPFDDEANHFWQQEVIQGRIIRQNADLYLHTYLTMMTGEESKIGTLFADFKRWYLSKEEKSVEDQLKSIHKYSGYYYNFRNIQQYNYSLNDEERRFFKTLAVFETTTVYPLILYLYGQIGDGKADPVEKFKIFKIVESFLIRRAICGMLTKAYNNLFRNALKAIRESEDYPSDVLTKFFMKGHDSENERWPNNDEFLHAWLRRSVKSLTRERLRWLLYLMAEKLEEEEGKPRPSSKDSPSSTLCQRNLRNIGRSQISTACQVMKRPLEGKSEERKSRQWGI